MNIEVNIELDGIIDDIDNIMEELDIACQEVITKSCLKIEADAKVNCPVDTGRLRDSIGSVFEFKRPTYSGTVGTDVYYATFIELGTGIYNSNGRQDPWIYRTPDGNFHFTRGIRPNPFMTNAFYANKTFLEKYLVDRISKALGG